jgi:hypothetical protein
MRRSNVQFNAAGVERAADVARQMASLIVLNPNWAGAMMIEKTLRRTLMTTAMLAAFSLSEMLGAAAAETTVYRDIRKPNGQERNMAAKQADFAACGHPVSVDPQDFPKFRTCMRAHGWVIDHVVPDPSAGLGWDGSGVGKYTYNDVLKPHGRARRNDEEQADTYVCDGGDSRDIGTPPFNACMRAHGWRFDHFEPTPASSDGGGVPDWAWTCPFANC